MTEDDLKWWLTLAGQLDWTFARTYAETAPHSYMAHPHTAGMAEDDYVRAAHVFHTFGQPAKFYNMTSIYLTSPDGRLKWWTTDKDLDETNLINQAPPSGCTGCRTRPRPTPGSALRTTASPPGTTLGTPAPRARYGRSGIWSRRSGATTRLRARCGVRHRTDPRPRPLRPDRYAGVDPSQPMLNMLVRKYPNVAAVYPVTIEELLAEKRFMPGQFEIVTAYGSADVLAPDTVAALATIASRALVLKRASCTPTLRDRRGSLTGAG